MYINWRGSKRYRCIVGVGAVLELCLQVSANAGLPSTQAPDLFPPQSISDERGTTLYWLTIARAKANNLQVSLGFMNEGTDSWVLEAALYPNLDSRSVQEILKNRTQVGFQLGPLEGRHTSLVMTTRPSRIAAMGHDPGQSHLRRLEIPIQGKSKAASRILVPEVDFKESITERVWHAWDIVVEREGAVQFSVHDASGDPVRTLTTGYVLQGPLTVLWDGLDDSGKPMGKELYFLQIEGDVLAATIERLASRSAK